MKRDQLTNNKTSFEGYKYLILSSTWPLVLNSRQWAKLVSMMWETDRDLKIISSALGIKLYEAYIG